MRRLETGTRRADERLGDQPDRLGREGRARLQFPAPLQLRPLEGDSLRGPGRERGGRRAPGVGVRHAARDGRRLRLLLQRLLEEEVQRALALRSVSLEGRPGGAQPGLRYGAKSSRPLKIQQTYSAFRASEFSNVNHCNAPARFALAFAVEDELYYSEVSR